MKTSVILANPNPFSFNHAIAKNVIEACLQSDHELFYHDLYKENFNPVASFEETSNMKVIPDDIKIYCDELKASDNIVIIHPNWWGQPPAIVKGWIDRVLRFGTAFRFEGKKGEVGTPIGMLDNKAVVIINTGNTPEEIEVGDYKDPLEHLWNKCIFEFCGVRQFYRRMFNMMLMSSGDQRLNWLLETQTIVKTYLK